MYISHEFIAARVVYDGHGCFYYYHFDILRHDVNERRVFLFIDITNHGQLDTRI